MNHALLSLACAFPPAKGGNGSLTTIADLASSMHLRSRLFVRTYADAVRLVIAANMERNEATGGGHAAARRLAALRDERARWQRAILEGQAVADSLNARLERARRHEGAFARLPDGRRLLTARVGATSPHDLPIAVTEEF